MKALILDCDYFLFPERISNIDEFVKFINDKYHSFVKMVRLKKDNCVPPYFIEGDVEDVYVNIAEITEITSEEIFIISEEEYMARLKEIVETKCINCTSYEEEADEDSLKGHREHISLDGDCFFYKKVKEN